NNCTLPRSIERANGLAKIEGGGYFGLPETRAGGVNSTSSRKLAVTPADANRSHTYRYNSGLNLT
ncbi:MAG: hypothetical protein AB7E55_27515, partial [Pigmentiphaga sp.]